MKKLTMWGIASLSIGVFATAMLSQATSTTAGNPMSPGPVVQSVSEAVAASPDFMKELFFVDGNQDSQLLSGLLRIGERTYNARIDPSVSRQIVGQYRMRKIGFGRLENIEVITSATGTYSSDGLKSPYVVYPGISFDEVKPLPVHQNLLVLVWDASRGWQALESSSAPSFLSIN